MFNVQRSMSQLQQFYVCVAESRCSNNINRMIRLCPCPHFRLFSTETIFALATPTGKAGIGIIRVSGQSTREVCPLTINHVIV